jgi:hypothetical protein
MFKSHIKQFKRFLICTLILTLGCKSHKETKALSSKLDCNKTIYFVWDPQGNTAPFEKRGTFKDSYASFFKGKSLDYKQIFIESVEKFNKKHKGQFLYKEYRGFTPDSVIQVTVELKKSVVYMGYARIIRDSELIYTTATQELQLLGSSNKKGSKGLLECLEQTHLQFLTTCCDN